MPIYLANHRYQQQNRHAHATTGNGYLGMHHHRRRRRRCGRAEARPPSPSPSPQRSFLAPKPNPVPRSRPRGPAPRSADLARLGTQFAVARSRGSGVLGCCVRAPPRHDDAVAGWLPGRVLGLCVFGVKDGRSVGWVGLGGLVGRDVLGRRKEWRLVRLRGIGIGLGSGRDCDQDHDYDRAIGSAIRAIRACLAPG
ncbi:uncharacterized protein K452DRAFT_10074 [Aplosporella prunicola CBS 121167]|uniref:Uncharacterized protein n=1 Tax=Aplosporella prunicola CBS 121167 TaxID=1176127 RepID=A0A6A6BF88_9PEZI|nr:uncharacterized protein K452DRAFT_10074 [Aplosporella prunicola CBS 121167]KAF2142736.1 hypothetical protein K452DRAFT_10074 [Aplosporella prunicola CBS 121167]